MNQYDTLDESESQIRTVGIINYSDWIRDVAPKECSVPNQEIFKCQSLEELLDMTAWMVFNYYASGPTAVFAGSNRVAKGFTLGGNVQELTRDLAMFVSVHPTAALYSAHLIFNSTAPEPHFFYKARILCSN